MVNHQQKIWCIAKGRAAVAVTFTEDMKLSMTKVNFLANNINKQRFVYLLGSYLEKKGKVYHAPGDADVLIVQKTVESSTMMETVQCAGW